MLGKVDSKYTLVHLAAKRAREINNYYHALGEGLGQYTPPLVDSTSNKPLSISLEEIAAEKIVVQHPGDARRAAEEMLGSSEGEGGEVVPLDPGVFEEAVVEDPAAQGLTSDMARTVPSAEDVAAQALGAPEEGEGEEAEAPVGESELTDAGAEEDDPDA
ncbi:DNA-directed RNA polymerase subunit omega [Egibacter rhizosphaerae]|uniref:DNA-directed RNA polymerase subunit omega n=1 Tax=Egibacter rhizosphaerae TaxID=1670831 RepID=UPI0023EA74A3|nr:DNA-directed RNA polymerase subunit omega [Egibacter rhizosphaerae]